MEPTEKQPAENVCRAGDDHGQPNTLVLQESMKKRICDSTWFHNAWKVGRIHPQHVPLVAGISNQERCHTKPITDITAHFHTFSLPSGHLKHYPMAIITHPLSYH